MEAGTTKQSTGQTQLLGTHHQDRRSVT